MKTLSGFVDSWVDHNEYFIPYLNKKVFDESLKKLNFGRDAPMQLS